MGFIAIIGDILIFQRNIWKPWKETMMKEGFGLKFIKCNFSQRKIQYLSHVIEENLVCPMKDNLRAIKDIPVRKTKKNIHQFLRKVNFYYEYFQ